MSRGSRGSDLEVTWCRRVTRLNGFDSTVVETVGRGTPVHLNLGEADGEGDGLTRSRLHHVSLVI